MRLINLIRRKREKESEPPLGKQVTKLSLNVGEKKLASVH